MIPYCGKSRESVFVFPLDLTRFVHSSLADPKAERAFQVFSVRSLTAYQYSVDMTIRKVVRGHDVEI